MVIRNDNLSLIAQELGMLAHKDDKDKRPNTIPKTFANAYESHLYQLYLDKGMEAAKEFVKETLL